MLYAILCFFFNFCSSARGNTSLESALSLTKSLRWDIQSLGTRLAKAARAEEDARRSNNRKKSQAQLDAELRYIILDMRKLLARVEDAVPLINLAITTSGVSLSTTLPPTISPSRLLQASTCLTAGDNLFCRNPNVPVQVGPEFTVSVYMLFAGHALPKKGEGRAMTWNEAIHKARLRLVRVPLIATYGAMADFASFYTEESDKDGTVIIPEDHSGANEFAYQLELIENLDDDRFHSFDDGVPQPQPFNGVQLAGIRENIPIHEISKIFYADTAKMLNLGSDGDANSPVLLLKRDVNASPPTRMMDHFEMHTEWQEDPEESVQPEVDLDDPQGIIDAQLREEIDTSKAVSGPDDKIEVGSVRLQDEWRLPPALDPEWVAFEVYAEPIDDGSEDEEENIGLESISNDVKSSREPSLDPDLIRNMANVKFMKPTPFSVSVGPHAKVPEKPKTLGQHLPLTPEYGPVRTSLSLLEMLIRLTSMQQFQQASHLAIPDEMLNFFLMESSTSGAGSDEKLRRRTREEAKNKVGFDPYDQSPVRRRSENYEDEQVDVAEEGRVLEVNKQYAAQVEDYDDERDWSKQYTRSPRGTQHPWVLQSRKVSSSRVARQGIPSSSPLSSNMLPRRATRPFDQHQGLSHSVNGSPLGTEMSPNPDSSLGTSPGTPSPGERKGVGEITRS